MEYVSWKNCQDFFKRLNDRLPGLALVLPSEAQWEYSCRAGTTTPFNFRDNITREQVNYDSDDPNAGGKTDLYRQETVPVASMPPNPWGLYEMHGNVWEWCQDHWHDHYKGAPANGSAWESRDAGADRVLRGGSWAVDAYGVRSAYRVATSLDVCYGSDGFRCARVRDEPSHKGAEPSLLRLDASQSPACCPLPQMPAFLIHTDRERLTFRRLTKPTYLGQCHHPSLVGSGDGQQPEPLPRPNTAGGERKLARRAGLSGPHQRPDSWSRPDAAQRGAMGTCLPGGHRDGDLHWRPRFC